LAASIRWVFSTPFGAPVEPDVKRIFAIAPASSAAKALATSWPGLFAVSSASRAAPGRLPVLLHPGSAHRVRTR
jgi:hypothetical protein